jgi:hypothetical protein
MAVAAPPTGAPPASTPVTRMLSAVPSGDQAPTSPTPTDALNVSCSAVSSAASDDTSGVAVGDENVSVSTSPGLMPGTTGGGLDATMDSTAGQQAPAPAAEPSPGPQGVQVEAAAAPTALLDVPAAQGVHAAADVGGDGVGVGVGVGVGIGATARRAGGPPLPPPPPPPPPPPAPASPTRYVPTPHSYTPPPAHHAPPGHAADIGDTAPPPHKYPSLQRPLQRASDSPGVAPYVPDGQASALPLTQYEPGGHIACDVAATPDAGPPTL